MSIPHPHAGVRVFVVDGTERKTGARHNVHERARIEGALPRVIERTNETLRGLIKRSARLHDLFFVEQAEYPTFAWQEAIVNAVAHRDYRNQGRGIEVWYFDDRIEFESPGPLLPDVEIEQLISRRPVHSSRNPMIVRVLTELGLMREQGEGIPRMFQEMERVWLPLPELASDERSFRVVLRNTPIFDVDDPRWVEHVRAIPGLSDRQRRILVAFRRGSFRSSQYQELNQVDRDTAYEELRDLVMKGLVRAPESAGRGAKYEVAHAGAANPATRLVVGLAPAGERHRSKLEAALKDEGKITNATYRECVGIDRHAATRELAALVAAGVLVREGALKSAVYLPGPRWMDWLYARQ